MLRHAFKSHLIFTYLLYMAPRYRKKPYARRIQRAWRRYRRKRPAYRRRGISSKTGVLTCHQYSSKTMTIPSVSAGTAGQFQGFEETFRLVDVPLANQTAFQRLFKFWRIKGVKLTFSIRYLGNSLAPAGETNPLALMNGTFMSSITLDSNQLAPNTPVWPNVEVAEQAGNLKKRFLNLTNGSGVAVVKLVPRLNNWIRSSPSEATNSVSALSTKGQWISTQSPSTNYMGLKWAYETLQPHSQFDIEVRKAYILEFKGVN